MDERKKHSEDVLEKHGIAINPYLPQIQSEEVRIKNPDEIVRRAVTAFVTSQIAIGVCNNEDITESVDFFTDILNRFNLTDELTDDEKIYFDLSECREISADDANEMQWRIEMCVPLFWACGIQKEINYPDELTDIVPLIRAISACNDFQELMSLVNMRPLSEILDFADLIFRMDWACVESRLKKDPAIMGDLFPDVVVEQHKGINWVIGAFDADDWDNIRPHT